MYKISCYQYRIIPIFFSIYLGIGLYSLERISCPKYIDCIFNYVERGQATVRLLDCNENGGLKNDDE